MFRYYFILISLFLYACNSTINPNCEGRFDDPDCGALFPEEEAELFDTGVTISRFSASDTQYETLDGVDVLRTPVFYFLPVAGTEDATLQLDITFNVDFAVSASSKVAFLDENGVFLDESNSPNCWQPHDFRYGDSQMVAVTGIESPDDLSFVLRTVTSCVPVTAKRIVHRYIEDNGEVRTVVDVELDSLRNWREIIRPLLCAQQQC